MNPQKLLTLGYLLKDDQILLAMKNRGFGAGKWNGVGGKVKIGESVTDSFIRETQEELNVTPTEFEQVAMHTFTYPGEESSWDAYVYFVTKWTGEISESEEMSPKWFKISEIPFHDMWDDDIYWLHAALAGNKLKAHFVFDENNKLTHAQITPVATFNN